MGAFIYDVRFSRQTQVGQGQQKIFFQDKDL